jgi:hypothetical protein
MILDKQNGNRLLGFYRGRVIKHLEHGKCKIYIPGVYDEEWVLKPSLLPDAEPATPLFGGGIEGRGIFSYPCVGSTVWCFFVNEDQNYPVYFAATLGGQSAEREYFEIKDNPEEESHIHKINVRNSEIKIYEDGKIENTVNNYTNNTDARVVVDALRNNEIWLDIVGQNGACTLRMRDTGKIELTSTCDTYINTPVLFADFDSGVVHANEISASAVNITVFNKSDISVTNGNNIAVLNKSDISVVNGNNITIKNGKSINIESSDINIQASNITVNSGTIKVDGGSVNINGGGGDVVVAGISLVGHVHPCAHGPTGAPM